MVNRKKNINLEEKSREVLGILTMVVGLFVLLSLVSHEPTEELSIIPGVHFYNWMGYAGIFISYVLFKMFIGWGSILIALLIVLWGYTIFGEKEFQPVFRFSGYSFSITLILVTLFGLIGEKLGLAADQVYRHAGYLTVSMAHLLNDFLGFAGALLILIALTLLVLQAWRSFSFRGVNDWIEDQLSQLKNNCT